MVIIILVVGSSGDYGVRSTVAFVFLVLHLVVMNVVIFNDSWW